MLSWRDVLAHHERYKDRLREAEREQIIQQMLPVRERRHRWQHRVVARLGCRLVTWGYRLQGRYRAAIMDGGAYGYEPHPVSRCAAVKSEGRECVTGELPRRWQVRSA